MPEAKKPAPALRRNQKTAPASKRGDGLRRAANKAKAAATPATTSEEPFYKRLLWSSDPAPQPAAQPEPSARPIPLPPRRQATAPAHGSKPDAKPEASLAPGGKVVAALAR